MELSIWNMAKRYITGAVVGLVVALMAGMGIRELPPEQLASVQTMVDSFLTFVFYVVTILYTRWRQKVKLGKGEVLPERVESNRTAIEHGTAPVPGKS